MTHRIIVKIKTIIKKVLKFTAYTLLALVLLVVGTVTAIYSPWLQDLLRQHLVDKVNASGDMTVTLDSFRLRFPLNLSLGGLAVIRQGDTIAAASSLNTSVALLPLIKGNVIADEVEVEGGKFKMKGADSLMTLTIDAQHIALQPVKVGLKDISINIEEGKLSDFNYTMSLLPAIDSLGVTLADATLTKANIDLSKQRVALSEFIGNRLNAVYLAPDSATKASVPVTPPDTVASAPWTIEIDSIGFSSSKALYTTRGLSPQPGLDFAYIEVDSLDLTVSHFFNQASVLRLPLKLRGTERCGVTLSADGTFALDSTAMYLDSLKVATPTTSLDVNATMAMGDMAADPNLPLSLIAKGGVGVSDLRKMFPAFLPYLLTLPANDAIDVDADIHGSMARLDLSRLDIGITRCVNIKASGYLASLNNPDAMSGDVSLKGHVINVNNIKKELMPDAKDLKIPPMTIDGHVRMASSTVSGRIGVLTGGGLIALDGRWNSRGQDYQADVTIKQFPIETFMPNLGAGKVTASLKAKGHGYDVFSRKMHLDADLNVASAQYQNYIYRDIFANATVDDGKARLQLSSDNPDTRLQLMAEGNLDGQTYDWTVIADGNEIDLHALGFSELENQLTFNLSGQAVITPRLSDYKGELTLNDFEMKQPASDIVISNVKAVLDATDSLTNLSLRNRDLAATFVGCAPLDTLIARFGGFSDELNSQIIARQIHVDALQRALPQFTFDLTAGSDNALTDILSQSKISFRNLQLSAENDSTLTVDSRLLSLKSGSTKLDTITFAANQYGEQMDVRAHVGNRPGTFDDWAQVALNAHLVDNQVKLHLNQHNIKGKQGFDIGLKAALVDSVATLSFDPLDQIIGYQPWTVNEDNFISYVLPTKHIDANLKMTGGQSMVEILTEHVEGSTTQEDLVVKLSDIHLADWIALNPFAPPVKGDLDANVRLREVDGSLNGNGKVDLNGFYYGKERVANIALDFDVTTKPGGTVYARSDVFIDGAKTMTLAGNLNDSTTTSPYNLDFSMIHFPLATVNPFLPPKIAKMRGTLNGSMRISGESGAPILNGSIDFDSTAVKLFMTNTEYAFSPDTIPVVNNVVTFDKFKISGVNKNPLAIDGSVDLTNLASPLIDLSLKANNMQLLNTSKASKDADIYGKAFISLDSRVHGNLNLLFVNADLSIVAPTNVTYVIPDATDNIVSRSTTDMVKFVNFTDTTAVIEADSLAAGDMALILDATLTIDNGTTIGIDLSTDGKNRVQLEADGTLNYTMSPLSDGRMTGRLNINEGYVRYTPPVISEKYFTFQRGSYVAFNGDVMNPTLNVHAVDVIKANVTQSGQNSRLIDFDVALNVTGTLNRMDVGFDLSTNDDVTVANELQSMSADQRANQAMNMLLYGIYTGPGTKGDASISGNALYSFLESQINSWAANNIKGVDLSFGIDQYDRTVDGSSSQTTSYSYQVSKSLFNDRFKIVVGGNYSTDANADENFSQNLINDISFEYFLNRGHTMYVRIFRHTGYESILEGEITQTGVGFVYRKKLNSLRDMFKFLRPRHREKK